MRPLVAAIRAARNPARTTTTPVPYAPRYAAAGYRNLLTPSGDEAQLHAVGANGTLFGIVDAYMWAMAGVEWGMYRPLPPGSPEGTERKPVTSHAALDLWKKPNKHYSRQLFVKTVTQHLELVGTGYAVVVKLGGLPVELWPVMPHRITPVPHPQKFIAGYVYTSPDGEQVPLGTDVVIRVVQTPCPWDPYRGMGAVQSVMTALSGARHAEEWHRKFFVNSARPDGVVEVPTSLSDPEFDEFQERWRETHQGVNNAFKVAMLEHGATWKPTAYSPHDMMFVDMQKYDSEKTREAYRISDTVMGKGQALNRATAEAQMFDFGSNHVVPRASAVWRDDFLNGQLLPMYGRTGQDADAEFGFRSPVPEDGEAKDRNIVAQSAAYKNYVDAGVDGTDPAMLRHLGLPGMKLAPTPPATLPAPGPPAVPEPAARLVLGSGHRHARGPRRALPAAAAEDDDEPDLSGVLTDLERELERFETDYQPVLDRQIESLVDQVRRAVDEGVTDDATAISEIAVPPELYGSDVVRRSLDRMAATAADRAVREVDDDVELDEDEVADQVVEDTAETEDVAAAVATAVAAGLTLSAVDEAIRLWKPGVAAAVVARQVRAALTALKGEIRKARFGAALHRLTNLGRGAVFTVALKVRPSGRAVASEQNDRNTCGPCAEINGHVFESLEDAQLVYGGGGYHACLGKWRCRGTYRMSWG